MPIPAKETRAEFEVSRSRFIASLAPVFSAEEARAFIARIRAEFADATHNVPAFVIGDGGVAHCNDDGEPSGTAGRPMLAVLQGSGLQDVAVVVTRYYGGQKLGTGGLVRAYGDGVRAVLAVTPLADKVATHTVMLALPYTLFERVKLLVAEHGGLVMDETFAADVTLTLRFEVARLDGFQTAVGELSSGELSAEIIDTNPDTILPR